MLDNYPRNPLLIFLFTCVGMVCRYGFFFLISILKGKQARQLLYFAEGFKQIIFNLLVTFFLIEAFVSLLIYLQFPSSWYSIALVSIVIALFSRCMITNRPIIALQHPHLYTTPAKVPWWYHRWTRKALLRKACWWGLLWQLGHIVFWWRQRKAKSQQRYRIVGHDAEAGVLYLNRTALHHRSLPSYAA